MKVGRGGIKRGFFVCGRVLAEMFVGRFGSGCGREGAGFLKVLGRSRGGAGRFSGIFCFVVFFWVVEFRRWFFLLRVWGAGR